MDELKFYLKIRVFLMFFNFNLGLVVDMIYFEGLELKIVKFNVILSEESSENMQYRFVVYGVYVESYSLREFNEYNKEKGFVDLLSFYDDVIFMFVLFDLCSFYMFVIERKKLLECNFDF